MKRPDVQLRTRALAAAISVVVLMAMAGCGGGSSTSDGTGSVATGASSGAAARLDRSAQRFVSATGTFLTQLNRCVVSKHHKRCVSTAARPADAVVTATRKDVAALKTKAPGACADGLDGITDAISQVTDDLRPMTSAALVGDFRAATQLGPDVQTQLRNFVASIRGAQHACTG
jgi:hypothetical protein